MDIATEIGYLDKKIAALQKMRDLLMVNSNALESIKSTCFESCETLNFNNVDREATIALIKTFPGKWTKSYRGDKVDYAHESGILCIFGGIAPETCRVVEKLVTIPAHTIIERVLECSPFKEMEVS